MNPFRVLGYALGICNWEPTAKPPTPTLELEKPLARTQDRGPNASTKAASGEALVGNPNDPAQYLSREEAFALKRARTANPQDLNAIQKLTQLALDKKIGITKAREHNLENILFKDIRPYYTSSDIPCTDETPLETAIQISPFKNNIDDLLLASAKFRITQIAGDSCELEVDYARTPCEKVTSHRNANGETIRWDTLTSEQAFSDLQAFETALKSKIAELEAQFN